MNTDGLKKLWKTVFGDTDEAIDSFFRIAYSPDRCRYTTEDGQIVCALYWLDASYEGGKLAYIYAVATNPEHRKKGLASNLLIQTHAQLKEQGYAGAILKPSNGLFPFYERLGYETCGSIDRFRAAPGTPVPVKELSINEYAQKRRALLPSNSVIQEDVTLEFFHTFAKFYEAGTTLIAAMAEENIIFEYLGDPAAASGILAALHMQECVIPTPGDQIPFAMYYPLNNPQAPAYLGISLE